MMHKIKDWKPGEYLKPTERKLCDEDLLRMERDILRRVLSRFPGDIGDPDLCTVTIDINVKITTTHAFPSLPQPAENGAAEKGGGEEVK